MILLYHGITDPSGVFDPFSLCVSPENFEEHLSILCRDAHPMGLEEMAQKLKNGGLPPRAVAITFDDGYADNFYLAKPLLEKFKIPATVFVITGFLGDTFWWDDLTRIILQPEKLPQRLSLKLDGSIYQSSLHN
ncbi:MAG: polysaccharide deacetylase family protein, partial [Anaerolineales bacterium]